MVFADLSSVVPELTVWSLRRDISKGQKGKLRNNEHLSNLSSLSQPCEGQHKDMVLTKQESCKLMARIMRVVE
jgi:hypothetical protein